MSAMFSKPKRPPTPPPMPTPKDPAVEEARRKEVIAASKMKGSAGTYLSGGDDGGAVSLGRKRLLGD